MPCRSCGNRAVKQTPPQPAREERGPFGVFATKEIRDARMKTCNSCPEFKPKILHVMSLCRICSCVLEGKTWLKEQVCPLGKWKE